MKAIGGTPEFSRLTLIAAVLLAFVAVGVSLWRTRTMMPEVTPATVSKPDVGVMIKQLETKLKADPGDAENWRMLGWSFFETGRFAESATAYRRATTIAPGKADYWSSLGEALVLAGPGNVPADAKQAFETALARDLTDPRARYFLAVEKDMTGDHVGAVADWLALLKDTPVGAPWEADVRRIVTQVAAKEKIDIGPRLATLAPSVTQASAAIPGPSSDQMRAAASLPPGQQRVMIKSMVEGLAAKQATNPNNVDGWITLMRSHVVMGNFAKAEQALATAVASNPSASDRLRSAARELGVLR